MKKLILLIWITFILVGCDSSNIRPYLKPGQDTVLMNHTWQDKGAYLEVGFNRIPMVTTDTVDTSQLGTHTITYRVTYKEETFIIRRLVQVVLSSDFSVSLAKGIDTIRLNETWVDSGLSTTLEIEFEVIGSVDSSKEGSYRIEYHITYQNYTKVLVRYVNVVS